MTTIYFVGVEAGVIGVAVDFFAFFFLAFFGSAFAGVAGVAVGAVAAGGFAAGATGVVPCASATVVKAAVTSAATKCFIALILVGSQKTTPGTRVDAINGCRTKKVDIVATRRTARPPAILPEQSKN